MTTFSFGDYDLSKLLICTAISRSTTPSRNLERTSVPGMDGCHVAETGLEPIEINVEVAFWATSSAEIADARRELASALFGAEKRLILPDEPDKYYLARFEGGDSWDRLYNNPASTFTFLCSDPIAYGKTRTETVGTTAKTVHAGGSYQAFPVVSCKPASGSYWTLFNITTGAFVRVEASFTGSQTVVLDMNAERCTVNNSDHAITVASDFFPLNGTQQLKTSSGTATLSWRERWL